MPYVLHMMVVRCLHARQLLRAYMGRGGAGKELRTRLTASGVCRRRGLPSRQLRHLVPARVLGAGACSCTPCPLPATGAPMSAPRLHAFRDGDD
jgi:hypothetical protein